MLLDIEGSWPIARICWAPPSFAGALPDRQQWCHYLPSHKGLLAHEDWTSGVPVKNPKDFARTWCCLCLDDSSFFREMLPALAQGGRVPRHSPAAGTEQALFGSPFRSPDRRHRRRCLICRPAPVFALIKAVRAQARLSRMPGDRPVLPPLRRGRSRWRASSISLNFIANSTVGGLSFAALAEPKPSWRKPHDGRQRERCRAPTGARAGNTRNSFHCSARGDQISGLRSSTGCIDVLHCECSLHHGAPWTARVMGLLNLRGRVGHAMCLRRPSSACPMRNGTGAPGHGLWRLERNGEFLRLLVDFRRRGH